MRSTPSRRTAHVSFSDKYLPEIINTFVICVLSEKSNGCCDISLQKLSDLPLEMMEIVLIRTFLMRHSSDYETDDSVSEWFLNGTCDRGE